MARTRSITIDDLWRLERLEAPSLSPDGAQVVATLRSWDMDGNLGRSALWLLSTLGGRPRRLTHCGEKDGQPAFSPHGDLIAFVARREQRDGDARALDKRPQLYLIAPDGGEAWRAAEVPTGVEAFRWCPDGRHLVVVSWVWPELKGTKAQARAMKAHDERKTTGVATGEAFYRWWDEHLPAGRVPHLLLVDSQTGKVRDLFEGSGLELTRADPGADDFDIAPDGRRIVFRHDPSQVKRSDGRGALAELDLKKGRITMLAHDPAWDLSSPRYRPDGRMVACIASHRAASPTAPGRLALVQPDEPFEVVSDAWDHEVEGPLRWEDDGSALLFAAEERGRRHLWRFDLADRRAERLVPGGWVQAFDKAAGTLVTLASAADHPERLHAHLPGDGAQPQTRRIESFNDALLAGLDLGTHEERSITGALGEPVQVWLHHPPGFDGGRGKAGRRWPLLHVIHGGPHTAMGDVWHYRWNAKLMAAQGYVVAIVNYHGSTGFGHAFADSITGRWGALELQDVEAATDALLKEPWADPTRVFASGGSYGGYMVAWMNGHCAPGRYAAYVCHAGCWDWVAMFADDAWAWHARDLGAWYWDDPQRVAAQSPVSFAGALSTPTLVVHGAQDFRVPDAQGLAYYNTLKARGIPARLLWYPDENHWILKPQNSRQWYGEFFDWLRAHDPGLARRGKGAARSATKPGVKPAGGTPAGRKTKT